MKQFKPRTPYRHDPVRQVNEISRIGQHFTHGETATVFKIVSAVSLAIIAGTMLLKQLNGGHER